MFGRSRKSAPAPTRPTLGQGRKLESKEDVDGSAEILAKTIRSLREPEYAHMPLLIVPGWQWHGHHEERPNSAYVVFDNKREFLFVGLLGGSSGTTVTMTPLALGDEAPTVGAWKRLDGSLTSCGLTERGLISLSAPPIADGFIEEMLTIAGYRCTPRNVEQLSAIFTMQCGLKASQFISSSNQAEAHRFIDNHPYRPGAGLDVARAILRDLEDWNRQLLPYIQDTPVRIRAILLEAAGASGTIWDKLQR